nr:hypothetical protein [Tanacetum cinerariifolium]
VSSILVGILSLSHSSRSYLRTAISNYGVSLGIDNDIYSTVDACPNACEMWKAIERLKQGESINVRYLKTNLYYEFGKFTFHDGESLESYYSSFAKPEFLKKAQGANPRMYDIGCYNDNLALMLAPKSDEECWNGLHEMAMVAFESQYIDKDTYSASAEDIKVQSYFLDDQLTNLSPPRNCMPPDVLLHESRHPT